jgi:CPA2 family monovalent cation:H+ antiporter-2
MLLDPAGILLHAGPIAALLLAVLAGKFTIVFLTAAVLRLPIRDCVLTGAALAQVGEFSFVLLRAASGTPLLSEPLAGNLLLAVILSMLVTPVAIVLGPRLAHGAGKLTWFNRLLGVRTTEEAAGESALRGHVVIAGYGLTGERLACALRSAGIPFVIADINPENVRRAAESGDPVYFGDISSPEVMEHLHLDRARDVVIAINDTDASERAVRAVRAIAPGLHIVARARYAIDVEALKEAGATAVIVSEVEAAVAISTLILDRLDVDRETREQQACDIRHRAGYLPDDGSEQ